MTDQELAELRWHWGSAYRIEHPRRVVWLAQRRDTREVLRGGSAGELLTVIRNDYAQRPVSRDRWP